MGVYSMNLESYEEYEDPNVDIDELVEDDEVEIAFEESSIETALKIAAESTQNWNAIIKACAITELNYLEENSTEMVYEGAKWDAFINKAKEFFLNIWKKIQEMFKKAMIQFNAWFISDKEFFKKYKEEFNRAKAKSFGDKTVKAFNYVFYGAKSDSIVKHIEEYSDNVASDKDTFNSADSLLAFARIADANVTDNADSLANWKEANKKLDSDFMKAIYDSFRQGILESASEVTSSEFVGQLKEKFQGGTATKDDIKLVEIFPEALSYLEKSEKIKKDLNSLVKSVKSGIDKNIRALTTLQKELDKTITKDGDEFAGTKHTVSVKFIQCMKEQKNIVVTAHGVILQCIKAASRQAKSICVTAVSTKPVNDSAFIQQESAMSLLDGVVLR